MKRTFLRILPLAVAVLLATSCSKDENNDNAVVNNGQETVQTKTLPISITVNQKGLSKLSCTGDMEEDLQPIFEPGDELKIYYKDGGLLKTLVVAEENITNDGKTAVFEGEIVGGGLVDDVTELTAKIGTPITAAVTATSREDAVKKGCYQTADFIYSAEGNHISLEEQNAYIEVVWKNKGGETVNFSIDGNPVTLNLNGSGQGWIVVPDEVSLTCEDLGITEAKTAEKANIYGIIRKFVPDGYVDLGVVLDDGTEVYFSSTVTSTGVKWSDKTDEERADWPTVDEFANLVSDCYWRWDNTQGHKGYYVFKIHADADKGKITNSSINYSPSTAYSIENDSYIFLPVSDGNYGYYWSRESDDVDLAFCLYFLENDVSPDNYLYSKDRGKPGVVTVRHSN
ncbi:MAG: hypothetical protein IKO99_03400 [Bacteroidales bacterium]|nr:hypothetical protein [Bacteroidales bacterium]